MSFTVDVSGYTPDTILEFNTEKPGDGQLSTATLVVGATTDNLDNIADGDTVTVDEDGERLFTGFVTGRPSRDGDGTLTVELLDERAELKHEDLNRVFYYMDSASAVEEAINKKAEQLDEIQLVSGDDIGSWTNNSVDQLVEYTKNGDASQIYETGSDAIYIGINARASGIKRATKSLTDPVAGGQLRQLDIRYALGSRAGETTAELELRANGRNYVWTLEPQTGSMGTATLSAADADNSGDLGAGDEPGLQARFDISGTAGDSVGLLIDSVTAKPFELVDRGTSFTTNNFPATNRTIVRDSSDSVFEFAEKIGTEDGRTLAIPSPSTLDYIESPGSSKGSFDIIQGQTDVVEVNFDRDAEQVINKVQVNGDGVQATAEDSASIDFYGVAPRDEPVTDNSIKTEQEAVDRATGIIRENAWKDNVATFKIADSSYRKLETGDDLIVDWSLQNFLEECIVRSVDTSEAGIVSLDLGVTT